MSGKESLVLDGTEWTLNYNNKEFTLMKNPNVDLPYSDQDGDSQSDYHLYQFRWIKELQRWEVYREKVDIWFDQNRWNKITHTVSIVGDGVPPTRRRCWEDSEQIEDILTIMEKLTEDI